MYTAVDGAEGPSFEKGQKSEEKQRNYKNDCDSE